MVGFRGRLVMRFGSRSAASAMTAKYRVDGEELKFVQTYRDLGVVVDVALRFHSHINIVVGKAGSLMG